MIPAKAYELIYLLVVTCLTIYESNMYASYSDSRIANNRITSNILVGGIVAMLIALFIGFRPLSGVFVDMRNYNELYYALAFGSDFSFDWNAENKIFDNLFYWFGSLYLEDVVFYVIISLGYFLCAYKAMTILFKKDAFYAFVVWMGAFSTFSFATNGIKAGIAGSVFLCALAYHKKPIIAAILLILCYGLHHSMTLPIGAFIVCSLYKKTNCYFAFWIFALLISLLHITFFQEILAGMTDDHGASYLNDTSDWGGKSGFRYDFVLYSALPVVVGYYAIFKCRLQSDSYQFIYNVYLLTNGIWMLCMYAAFTNRIAYLSWSFLPVVTMYPFFTKKFMPNQYRLANKLVWFQLIFTLAMTFIYYG